MTNKIDSVPTARPAPAPAAAVPVSAAIERSGGPRTQAITAIQATSADNLRLTGEAEALWLTQRQTKAGPPPMDMAKIESLRAALASGAYRIDPMEIARRLDALERQLSI